MCHYTIVVIIVRVIFFDLIPLINVVFISFIAFQTSPNQSYTNYIFFLLLYTSTLHLLNMRFVLYFFEIFDNQVVTDASQNVNVFQYAPTKKQSHQSLHLEYQRQINYERRLLCTTSFHLGQDVVASCQHPLSQPGVMEFGTMLGSTDGGKYSLEKKN